MNIHVLVLDSGYQPVERTTWQDAIVKVFKGAAEVVEYYADKVVHSASEEWQVPSVIRLVEYLVTNKKKIKFSRANIFARDKGKCQYCGKAEKLNTYTMDHVVPRARGGVTKWENIVVCCWDCNQKKSSRTLEQVGMRLRTKPSRPTNLRQQFDWIDKNIPETWRDYLYWHGALEQS